MANQPDVLFPSDRRSLLQIVRSFICLLDDRVAGRGDHDGGVAEMPGGISFDTFVCSLLQHVEERDAMADPFDPEDDEHVETIDDPEIIDMLEADAEEDAILDDGVDRERLTEIVETLRGMLEQASDRRQDPRRN